MTKKKKKTHMKLPIIIKREQQVTYCKSGQKLMTQTIMNKVTKRNKSTC